MFSQSQLEKIRASLKIVSVPVEVAPEAPAAVKIPTASETFGKYPGFPGLAEAFAKCPEIREKFGSLEAFVTDVYSPSWAPLEVSPAPAEPSASFRGKVVIGK